MQVAEPTEIDGALVILDVSPVRGAISCDDAKVIVISMANQRGWTPLCLVPTAELHHNLGGDHQLDVEASPPTGGNRSGVALRLCCDLIAEESRLLRCGVSDQSLIGGEFQLEMIAQELPETGLDRLGFPFRSHEAQKEVIGIADVLEAAIVRVVRHLRWYLCQDTAQFSIGRPIPLSLGDTPLLAYSHILRIDLLGLTFRVDRADHLFDVPIELVQVDIREQGAGNPALWRATEGGMIDPLLHVSCLEHVLDQLQEAVVVDLVPED